MVTLVTIPSFISSIFPQPSGKTFAKARFCLYVFHLAQIFWFFSLVWLFFLPNESTPLVLVDKQGMSHNRLICVCAVYQGWHIPPWYTEKDIYVSYTEKTC